jgi:tryptophan 2,3-dioxygenase
MVMSTAELSAWFDEPEPEKFPYEAIVREFQLSGKHFVAPELLDALTRARALLPQINSPWPNVHALACFLDTALDKPDGRYDYPSYLALPLLQLPSLDDPIEQTPFARSRCDRLIVQLATDALYFELEAADGRTNLLPGMRPDPEFQLKRYRLALRAIGPALSRLSLDSRVTQTEPQPAARQACAVVRSDMSISERRTLLLTMLPVYTLHDEYMFLRVLQLFETTFALIAVLLRAALAELVNRDAGHTIHFLDTAENALREGAPLFSMLATMRIESFRTFREYTDGASAIQSRNYKIVESLCKHPDTARLDSLAYQSVPEVRERVRTGRATIDAAFRHARDSGELSHGDCELLDAAMRRFSGTLVRWRTTHHRLAVRMLGDLKGSGYTAGTPYLAAGRTIPVFDSIPALDDEVVTA